MKTIRISVLIALISLLGAQNAQTKCIGTTNLNMKRYYVDVTGFGTYRSVWFRVQKDMCSAGDIRIMDIKVSKTNQQEVAQMICRGKKMLDAGKTILGCGSVVATGICGISSVPTLGGAAAVCFVAIVYMVDKGVADCINGVSGPIASFLGFEKEWAAIGFQTGVSSG